MDVGSAVYEWFQREGMVMKGCSFVFEVEICFGSILRPNFFVTGRAERSAVPV